MYKITLKNTFLHLKKILTHKYYVAKYCFKVGLYWQGITHDLSKFSPIEFWESVKYYKGTSSPINEAKKDLGYSSAWQHHKGRNPHHYEYWTDKYDEGTVCIKMPYKYAVEMVCDYISAARAYLGDKFTYVGEFEWWLKKKETAKMHKDTAYFLTIVFSDLAEMEREGHNPDNYLTKKNIKGMWDYSEHDINNIKSGIWDLDCEM